MTGAAMVHVDIWDIGGMELTTAALPVDESVSAVTAALIRNLQLPQTGADGQTISYKLNHHDRARQMLPTETLRDAGVEDGHVLRIIREIMAG